MSNLSTFKTAALTFILSLVGFLGVYHVFHWGNVKKMLLVTIKVKSVCLCVCVGGWGWGGGGVSSY